MNQLLHSFGEHIRLTKACLADCKTDRAKKTFLTKDIKQQEAFLEDVKKAVAGSGWFNGEKWFSWDIKTLEGQLCWSKNLREKMN